MNLKKILRLSLAIPTAATLAACGGGDDNNISSTGCPSQLGNLTVTELAPRQCQISGTLTQDATLTSAQTWFLEGPLQIGDDTSVATLNIDPGTEIHGDNVDTTDYVLVFPGSTLRANGSSANPVLFLSDDNGVDGSGEWGGVFLHGFNGLPTLNGTQGANNLNYVVIAEAGAAVNVTIDGNNVTYEDNLVLNGVDATTTLTFVQSHNSARDGLQILNGDPRLSWILATGATRDGVWYRDFNGLIKDLMVIHHRDTNGSTGRAGIYASKTITGISNPRLVNITLVGRDDTSIDATALPAANEFGILFADNTDQIRLANVLIANFRNGCYEADTSANLSAINTSIPGPNYLDGVHCANEAGAIGNFGVVRTSSIGFPSGTVAPTNIPTAMGLVYYDVLTNNLIAFTGEIENRGDNFTSSWYLNNIGGFGNGLVGNPAFLHGFLNGDTNQSAGAPDFNDTMSPFIISDDSAGTGFNLDVANNTFGYDLTHIGAVRGGAITNNQFDGWTVATSFGEGFVVEF